jgi:uncharacterized protein (TIGR03437 family)
VTATLVVTSPAPPPTSPPGPPLATLSATPSSLQFAVAGCAAASTISSAFSFGSTASGLVYSAQSSAPWLTVGPQYGLLPGTTVTVSVNEAGLAVGVNSATVTITGPGAASLVIPVTVTVTSGDPLVVLPAQFTLSAPSGGSSVAQNLAVSGACSALSYTAQADQPWISLTNPSGQTPALLAVTASAATLPQGLYNGHVTITSSGAPNSPLTIPVTFTVGSVPLGVSVVYAGVNSATFIPGPIAPGSLFSIFGENFTSTAASAAAFPLPTQLAGISVSLNSILLPLLYVGPSQINAQAPYELPPGPIQVSVISNGTVLGTITMQIAVASPGIFAYPDGSGHAAALNGNYSVNSSQNPATPGGYLLLYATGLGAVTPAVTDGSPAPSSPLSYTVAKVLVTIGGQPATVAYAGLAPGFAGLSQLNVLVPNLPPGDYPLVITVNDVASNAATVTIGQ